MATAESAEQTKLMGYEKASYKSRRRKLAFDRMMHHETLSAAHNHRSRWTEAEINMAMDRSRTARSIALQLGRSVKGVLKVRYMANQRRAK